MAKREGSAPAKGSKELRRQEDAQLDRNALVWKRFAEIYGDRFLKNYGDYPPKMWTDLLEKLSDLQIQGALAELATGTSEHPPSLPAFYQICKSVVRSQAPRAKTLPHERDLSPLARLAGRVFIRHVMKHGGMKERLSPMLAEKNRLVAQYEAIEDEEKVDRLEFVNVMDGRLTQKWEELRDDS